MILSSRSLRQRLGTPSGEGGIIIEPYGAECQQPASYDLRASEDYELERGVMTLIASMEWVEFPADLSGGFVDPGFRGHLTLCLLNMGSEDIHLKKGDRIVQMVLSGVSDGDEIYQGRYQDSNGVVSAR